MQHATATWNKLFSLKKVWLPLAFVAWFSSPSANAAELRGITAISAGGQHNCAITAAGAVKCWGLNTSGQLGDNSTTQRATPANATGLGTRIASVASGYLHTCALTRSGGVKCWGDNTSGQLGDATTTRRLAPIDVPGLGSGIAAVASGTFNSCALTVGGGVKCWGNARGVGVVNAAIGTPPVDVTGLISGVAAITTGTIYSCALTVTGGIKCWGLNNYGQLGDGSTNDRSTPVDVVGLGNGVAAIAASASDFSNGPAHTCALTTAGGVKCWGSNVSGALGDGSPMNLLARTTPVDVMGLSTGVVAIALGQGHSCALTTAGGVKCWGDASSGQLGNGFMANRSTPVEVAGLASRVVAITAGRGHTCALTATGSMRCWGNDGRGQLGDNFGATSLTPVDVPGLGGPMVGIATGSEYTCALTPTGGAKCWGRNDSGQLGDGTVAMHRLAPGDVAGLGTAITAIAPGYQHTCALTVGGGVKCWGSNFRFQLGDNTNVARLTPVDVVGLDESVKAVTVGNVHSCALTAAGGVKCWGTANGQLGNPGPSSPVPIDVDGLTSGVTAISAGIFHTCALTNAGGVKCWGFNRFGQLGDNSTTDRVDPVDVVGLTSGIVAISAGVLHTCATTAAGGAKCWGGNGQGQLGDGTTTDRLTAVDVTGLAGGIKAIAAGGGSENPGHTCALTTAGGTKCWGYNGFGQLGDGSLINQSAPVDVIGLASGVTAMDTGAAHTCALTNSGALKCWGYSYYGQIGNGSAGVQTLPVAVVVPDNVLVVEFYNKLLDNYFITADVSEALAIDHGSAGPGWTRTGAAFKAGGSTEVCRFYGSQLPGPNSHFYALDGSECQGLMDVQFSASDPRRQTVKSWNFESFDFTSTRPTTGQCPAGTAPVYRAYNNGFSRGIDSNHRIVSSQTAIAQVVARGWIAEGVVMCAPV